VVNGQTFDAQIGPRRGATGAHRGAPGTRREARRSEERDVTVHVAFEEIADSSLRKVELATVEPFTEIPDALLLKP